MADTVSNDAAANINNKDDTDRPDNSKPKSMIKYHILNILLMIVDSLIMAYISSASGENSRLKVTPSVYMAGVLLSVAAAFVNIAEIGIMSVKKESSFAHMLINIIMLAIPYLIYTFI